MGLEATEVARGTPPRDVEALARQVEEDGGAVLARYRDPFGGRWLLLCAQWMDRGDMRDVALLALDWLARIRLSCDGASAPVGRRVPTLPARDRGGGGLPAAAGPGLLFAASRVAWRVWRRTNTGRRSRAAGRQG